MIEVFKTDIRKMSQAKKLVAFLMRHFPGHRINIDLHDCDKILRVEGNHFASSVIMQLVREHGFMCSVLE
jgi:hypothetical protein